MTCIPNARRVTLASGGGSATAIFSTTFNIASVEQISASNTGTCGGTFWCDARIGTTGDGLKPSGNWTTSAGKHDEIVSAANNSGGGGGLGFRHWMGDGLANSGGGLQIDITSLVPGGVAEMYLRYYLRFPLGCLFDVGGNINWKSIYVNAAGRPGTFYWGLHERSYGGHVESDPTDGGNRHTSIGLDDMLPGAVGDGAWHIVEVHARMNPLSAVSDGILESKWDGTLVGSWSNLRFSTTNGAKFEDMEVGENHNGWNNGGDIAVDIDDFAISTDDWIGAYQAGRGF